MGNRALHDAGVAGRTPSGARFRAAGLNLPEFGMQSTTQPLAFGATHNPSGLDRIRDRLARLKIPREIFLHPQREHQTEPAQSWHRRRTLLKRNVISEIAGCQSGRGKGDQKLGRREGRPSDTTGRRRRRGKDIRRGSVHALGSVRQHVTVHSRSQKREQSRFGLNVPH
jgi:hypothetical protein